MHAKSSLTTEPSTASAWSQVCTSSPSILEGGRKSCLFRMLHPKHVYIPISLYSWYLPVVSWGINLLISYVALWNSPHFYQQIDRCCLLYLDWSLLQKLVGVAWFFTKSVQMPSLLCNIYFFLVSCHVMYLLPLYVNAVLLGVDVLGSVLITNVAFPLIYRSSRPKKFEEARSPSYSLYMSLNLLYCWICCEFQCNADHAGNCVFILLMYLLFKCCEFEFEFEYVLNVFRWAQTLLDLNLPCSK